MCRSIEVLGGNMKQRFLIREDCDMSCFVSNEILVWTVFFYFFLKKSIVHIILSSISKFRPMIIQKLPLPEFSRLREMLSILWKSLECTCGGMPETTMHFFKEIYCKKLLYPGTQFSDHRDPFEKRWKMPTVSFNIPRSD